MAVSLKRLQEGTYVHVRQKVFETDMPEMLGVSVLHSSEINVSKRCEYRRLVRVPNTTSSIHTELDAAPKMKVLIAIF